MKAKTLRRLVSVLAALVMAVSLLAGCGTKTAEQVQQHHGQHAEMRPEACAPHKIDYNNQQTAPQKRRYKGKQGYLHIISLLCSAAQLRTDRPFFPARQSAFLPARIRLIWQVF